MKKIIRVGSRDSKLAVKQTLLALESVKKIHPEIEFELVTMKTTGDKILDRNLDRMGGKGLFVKELDTALSEGRVDITVHSLKDLPIVTPDEPAISSGDSLQPPASHNLIMELSPFLKNSI